MDTLKLFSRNDNVLQYCVDICMGFGFHKCAKVTFKNGIIGETYSVERYFVRD